MKTTPGYKAFDKGLKCNGFHYEVGKTYTHEGEIKVCESGFHFCENPLDVLDYYDVTECEFAKVEALGEIETEGNKSVTNKIKIVEKLDLESYIKECVEFLSANNSSLVSAEYDSKLASSGDKSQLASSGNHSQLSSSGFNSKLASSGDNSQLTSSGNHSQLASSGDKSQLASAGNHSKLSSAGSNSRLVMTGKNNVGANIGIEGTIQGKKGDWITLAEYKEGVCVCVKSAKIDGEKIKEDTFYQLKNGEFTAI